MHNDELIVFRQKNIHLHHVGASFFSRFDAFDWILNGFIDIATVTDDDRVVCRLRPVSGERCENPASRYEEKGKDRYDFTFMFNFLVVMIHFKRRQFMLVDDFRHHNKSSNLCIKDNEALQ